MVKGVTAAVDVITPDPEPGAPIRAASDACGESAQADPQAPPAAEHGVGPRRPAQPGRRRHPVVRVLGLVLTGAALAGWFVFLRPAALGGSTDYIVVSGTSMNPTFKAGDLVVVRRRREYHTGDVVTYRVPTGQPGAGRKVIHRIIGGSSSTGFMTRGDDNPSTDMWHPTPADILGTRWVVGRGVGRYLVRLRDPLPLATLAALVAFLSVLLWDPATPGRARH